MLLVVLEDCSIDDTWMFAALSGAPDVLAIAYAADFAIWMMLTVHGVSL